MSARRRPPLPVLRPTPERWLSLALVVDAGPSMVIWRSLVDDLRTLFAQLGAFRDVRTWYLHVGPDGHPGIHPEADPADALRSPRELMDRRAGSRCSS